MNFINKIDTLPKPNLYLLLIPHSKRKLFLCYLRFIYLLTIRALQLKKTDCNRLKNLTKAVYKQFPETYLLGKLQKEFIKENISLSLLTEPIDGFLWILENRYELDFVKASPILLQIISPISRFIAVINKEPPLLYIPLANFIFAYLILYLKQSPFLINVFKNNKINFNSDNVDKYLSKHFSTLNSSLNIKTNFLFKQKLCFFTGLYKILITSTAKKINFFSYVNAFLYGLYYYFTTKKINNPSNQI